MRMSVLTNGSAPDKLTLPAKGSGFLSITIAMESTIGNDVDTETSTRAPAGTRRGAFTFMALLGVLLLEPTSAVTVPATVSAAKAFRGQSAANTRVGLMSPAPAEAAIALTAMVPLRRALRLILITCS